MDSITIWTYSLIAGGVVILIVAALLILIILAARSIDHHAKEIWLAGKNIAGNTVSIWMLKDTNETAGEILQTAGDIAGTANKINQKLDLLGQAVGQAVKKGGN
ncbi:MAG: hypothetical protein M3405_08650 [Acidobacteriota bacterium]|jgi:hypothetical protein|nr:hypothetical protein [Acidobacteriota bacterium]